MTKAWTGIALRVQLGDGQQKWVAENFNAVLTLSGPPMRSESGAWQGLGQFAVGVSEMGKASKFGGYVEALAARKTSGFLDLRRVVFKAIEGA
ncbi:hypothetical protein D3C85_1188700 [compost metagenome]